MRQPTLSGAPPRLASPAKGGRNKLGRGVVRLLQAPAALAVSTAAGPEPLCNLPPELSGEQGERNKIRHPKSDQAARCTSKCVSTCVLGGYGAPGIGGPFNVRRPLVVFKDTFRSRQYWYALANHEILLISNSRPWLVWTSDRTDLCGCGLVECSDICNLIKDGEDDQ